MSGYIKKCMITLLPVCVAVLCFVFITGTALNNASDVSKESITTLNHIVKTAGEHRDDLTALEDIDVDFVIVDAGDHLLYSHVTEGSSPDKLSVGEAIKKRYPYSYLSDGGKIWGAAILLDDPADVFKKMIFYVTAALIIIVLLMGVLMILYGLYIRKSIVMPFRNMKDFAAKVAQGKLDEPLRMDKDNMFGVFSESFDIMREELAETKERELELQKKERELVASLSHDLKTPVTGIKLTAELIKMRLSVKTDMDNTGEYEGEKIYFTAEELHALNADAEGIYQKAEQIDSLLADLFTSTLDDLKEFKVACRDEESKILADIVKSSDERALTVMDDIPSVIINIDRRRMSQVIGNVISNSYKYADTRIDIAFRISGKYLEMQITDHGPGVPKAEIDLITNKFYRGKDWRDTDKDGNGLGLYIAKMLMNKMSGDLLVESDGRGVKVTLVIPLS
jgi:signal transduction histidine kinase